MKLSIVIICWNDWKVLENCLASIYQQPGAADYEVIVSDNGSADRSVEFVRARFPRVKVVENGANLGFAKGNNAGIRHATGDYVLILNPDTIIQEGALSTLLAYADKHPEAGAFGCRILNPDLSYQISARPLPSLRGYLIGALLLRKLAYLSSWFDSDIYIGWAGDSERSIGYHSGCCVLFRQEVLKQLGGFDERFFYHFEETDLCCRTWKLGKSILFCPEAKVVHLGGQSVGRFPVKFKLETYRGRYRYFYKHFGLSSLGRIRSVSILSLALRVGAGSVLRRFKPSEALQNQMNCYKVLLSWNWRLDPVAFIRSGAEPASGYEPLAPPPRMIEPTVA